MVRLRPRSLLTLFLIGVFAIAVLQTWPMPIQARLFPLTIASVAIPLLLWQLAVELSPRRSRGQVDDSGVDFAATEVEKSLPGQLRAAEFFAWLFGFTLALWGLGFRVAIPVFLFLILLRYREGARLAASFALAGWAVTHWVFGKTLNLPLPTGAAWPALGL